MKNYLQVSLLILLILSSFCVLDAQEKVIKSPNKEEIIPNENDSLNVDKEPAVDMDLLKKNLIYPLMAEKAGIEGKVIVRVYVDSTGKPRKTIIVESSSEKFNQAAIDAVLKTVFTPAYKKGKPIGCWVTIPIIFKLKTK